MPIKQDRLIELFSLVERTPDGCTFDLPVVEAHSLLLELTISRERFGVISGGAARDMDLHVENTRLRADRVKLQGEIERLTHELAEAHATRPFPPDFVQRVDDGAATTVAGVIAQVEEPVAESEPLKPQRGDRVRLEGARSLGNTKLQDRWYDVTGATEQDFQVEAGIGRFWIVNDDPGLKEVRRGAAKLPE